MHLIVWAFEVEPSLAAAFERAYGPDGDWARLFRRCHGYHGTELIRDAERPGRYLTLDRWRSAADFAAGKASLEAEYAALDRRCEALTRSELLLAAGDLAP